MSEDEARAWVIARFGGAAQRRLACFADIVAAEANRQNLIAPSTLGELWNRHIVDSAQLIDLAAGVGAGENGLWIDIGPGAGFPGMVVALLTERPVLLVEPRRRRATFLRETAVTLDLAVETQCAAIESFARPAEVISARAVAALPVLFERAWQCIANETVWVLPKGRSAREEVASTTKSWHGVFHVEQSVTDPESLIVLASGVSRR